MARRFDERLIPPGINDARTRWLWGAFDAAVEQFDFHRLLMRTSAEMTSAMLPVAVWELSLEEFWDPEGLPETIARGMIDRAYELHAKKGTDEGVLLGLELLGYRARIVHWWQMSPRGHHDTHRVEVEVRAPLYPDHEPISERTQAQITRMIDATKRWSQDTWLRLALTTDGPERVAVATVSGAAATLRPVPIPDAIDLNAGHGFALITASSAETFLRPPVADAVVTPPTPGRALAVLAMTTTEIRPQ